MPNTGLGGEFVLRVENLAGFARVMRTAVDVELPRQMRRIALSAAEIVAEAARGSAPRGPTGRLVGSIRATAGAGTASVKAGGTIPYALAVHWGWWKPDSRGVSHGIRRNPFLFNALRDRAPEVQLQYERGMIDFGEEISRRL